MSIRTKIDSTRDTSYSVIYDDVDGEEQIEIFQDFKVANDVFNHYAYEDSEATDVNLIEIIETTELVTNVLRYEEKEEDAAE